MKLFKIFILVAAILALANSAMAKATEGSNYSMLSGTYLAIGYGKSIPQSKIKHSNFVRRVQRKWRTGCRRTSYFGVLAYRCQRGWRAHILRSLGTKRTIVGLLGRNIEEEYKPPPSDHTLVYVYVALFLMYISEYF